MLRRLSPVVAGLLAAGSARADWVLHMPWGVTELSPETYALHAMIFYAFCVIAAAVFGAMIYSLLTHRRTSAAAAANFSHSMTADVVWTLIPIAMVLVTAFPPAESLVRLADGREPELTIVATAYDLKWHYAYQDRDVAFFSSPVQSGSGRRHLAVEDNLPGVDRPLIVPRDAWVRLLLTPGDVVHAWRMPDFEVRQLAATGLASETWFRPRKPGVFRSECAGLCGIDHKFMPLVVEVVEPDDFELWLDDAKGATARYASAE